MGGGRSSCGPARDLSKLLGANLCVPERPDLLAQNRAVDLAARGIGLPRVLEDDRVNYDRPRIFAVELPPWFQASRVLEWSTATLRTWVRALLREL